MSINNIPDELLLKIFQHLALTDKQSYTNLALVSKRFLYVAFKRSIFTPEWIDLRPVPCIYRPHEDEDPSFRGMLAKALLVKYRTCSSIKLMKHQKSRGQYTQRLNVSEQDMVEVQGDFDRLFAEHEHADLLGNSFPCKVSAIVDLELGNCKLYLEHLDIMLKVLANLSFLTLNHIELEYLEPQQSFLLQDAHESHLHQAATGKLHLRRLSINNSHQLDDSVFRYFYDNLAASELDLSENRNIIFHERISRRFYHAPLEEPDEVLQHPSDRVLTFTMIIEYLKRHKKVVKLLNLRNTSVSAHCLRQLLVDKDLRDFQIKALY